MKQPYLAARAVLSALALAVLATAPATAHEVPGVGTGAVFNDPGGSAAEQSRVRDHIVRLIGLAPRGAVIHSSLYALDDTVVSDALIAAHRRGVAVRLVLDEKHSAAPASRAVLRALGTDRSRPSHVVVCPRGTGCVSTVRPSINHNKFFLFSRTGDAENVVVTSSANFTGLNLTRFFNNVYTQPDSPELHRAYRDFWTDQASGTVRTEDYGTTSSLPGGLELATFPRASGDPLAEAVSGVEAVDGGGEPAVIRVATPSLTRTSVAEALRSRARAGAKVEIAYTAMGASAGPMLEHPNITLHHLDGAASGAKTVHSKYLAVDGNLAGSPDGKTVWVGSHNLNMSSLVDDDENVLRVPGAAVHDAYRDNFRELRAYALARP
ncbi:phospholipase D-like domain-containing protein [Streptomyces sp. HNM0574]|uniref:phospholipase D-like domain-containing protein n=1 Tax=Streptomyces sp. HNM0574 TaxID=2714954 RepID=UPI00146DB529|nr:hypothetical protein [Streptomyces sp. HNM0574]